MNMSEIVALEERRAAFEAERDSLEQQIEAISDTLAKAKRQIVQQSGRTLCLVKDPSLYGLATPGQGWKLVGPVDFYTMHPQELNSYVATHKTIWVPARIDSLSAFWYNETRSTYVPYVTSNGYYERSIYEYHHPTT